MIKNLLESLKLPSTFSPLYLQIKFKPRLNALICEQARSQKFAMRGAVLGIWGLSLQTAEAIGGLQAKPQPQEAWGPREKPQAPGGPGSGGGAPSAQKFCIFLQK